MSACSAPGAAVNVVWSNSLPQHVEKIKLVMNDNAAPTQNNIPQNTNSSLAQQGYDSGGRTCQAPTPSPNIRQNRLCERTVYRTDKCHEDTKQDCLPIRETNHRHGPDDDEESDYGKAEDLRDAAFFEKMDMAAAAPEPLEKETSIA